MADFIFQQFGRYLEGIGVSPWVVFFIYAFIFLCLAIVGGVILLKYLERFVETRLSDYIVSTASRVDDVFLNQKTFHFLSHLLVAIFLYLLPAAFLGISSSEDFGAKNYIGLLESAALLYVWGALAAMAISFIDGVRVLASKYVETRGLHVNVTGMAQIAKMLIAFLTLGVIVSLLLRVSVQSILGTVAALMAVLIVLFRDVLLGFAAGIQLSANKMLKIGDTIRLPNFNAEGKVVHISLSTVKVLNFDKTTTSIPIYSLISQPFTSNESMLLSRGKVIKVNFFMDIHSIELFDQNDFLLLRNKMRAIKSLDGLVRDFFEILDYSLYKESPTNLKLFLMYIRMYIENHAANVHETEEIRDGQMHTQIEEISSGSFLTTRAYSVKLGEPTYHGVPIEVSAFAYTKDGAAYHQIQSNLVDHVIGVSKIFDLLIYQRPSGV